MSRDESFCVADMVEACARVVEYTTGLSAAALRGDRKTIEAVVRRSHAKARSLVRTSVEPRRASTEP